MCPAAECALLHMHMRMLMQAAAADSHGQCGDHCEHREDLGHASVHVLGVHHEVVIVLHRMCAASHATLQMCTSITCHGHA